MTLVFGFLVFFFFEWLRKNNFYTHATSTMLSPLWTTSPSLPMHTVLWQSFLSCFFFFFLLPFCFLDGCVVGCCFFFFSQLSCCGIAVFVFFFFKSLETTHVPCLVKCFVFLPLFRFARVRSCRCGVCVCMCFLVIVSRPIACFTTVKKKKSTKRRKETNRKAAGVLL